LLVVADPVAPVAVEAFAVGRRVRGSVVSQFQVEIEHSDKGLGVGLFVCGPQLVGVVIVGDVDADRIGGEGRQGNIAEDGYGRETTLFTRSGE
jgi:hypothetical protein